jgi:hypothetical protein
MHFVASGVLFVGKRFVAILEVLFAGRQFVADTIVLSVGRPFVVVIEVRSLLRIQ